MKKALLVVAAAGAAAFANSKYKSHTVGKELWKQTSDKPGEKSISASAKVD